MLRAWGDDTVRGGQTVFHGLRMWSQLVRVGLLMTAVLVVGVPGVQLLREVPGYHLYAAGMLTLAEVKLGMGYQPDAGQEVLLEDGETVVTRLGDIAAYDPWHAARDHILETVRSGVWLGVQIGLGAVGAMLGWFRFQGRRLKRKKRVRGAELVSARELGARVRPLRGRIMERFAGAQPPYRIAGVPYPERAETQHTIVSGTTGSGKTVLISDIVQQIRKRGERCVIYDKMGSYTRSFFDPERDVLLNPLDARAPRWSPFFEARGPSDFDTMAAALIPQQKDTVDPFWVTAARQLFSNGAGVLWQKGERKNRVLVEHLLKTDLSDLAGAMEGTVAQSIVDPKNPKTALSVRAMLTANIGAMEVLSDSGRPFSIREWISRDEDDSFLFLTSRGDQHASLRGLISTWLEIAVNAMLSLDQDAGRRIWVILDELPTLHQVPSLQPGLAESRQFGGCFVLGVQVAAALRDLYGKNGAETLSGLCGTRVVFAAPDRDTAQWSADSLGRSEIEEISEGVSYGADPYRDGVTLMPKREVQSLALPSEIMRLPNLTGYLKLPGPFPVARIELQYVERATVAPRFVARRAPRAAGPSGGEDGGGTNGAGADGHDPEGVNGPGDGNGKQALLPLDGETPGPGESDEGGSADEGAKGPDERIARSDANARKASPAKPAKRTGRKGSESPTRSAGRQRKDRADANGQENVVRLNEVARGRGPKDPQDFY